MSTSLLYHAFNLKGIRYRSVRFSDGIVFKARMTDQCLKCPECGYRQFILKGVKTRRFLLSPMGRKHCRLDLEIHRAMCRRCKKIFWPKLPFMVGKHRYARCFALTVLDLLKFATIKAVAQYLGVGWDLIKQIHKDKLNKRYKKIPLNKIKYLGIDEFSIKKNHNYMTIFIDLSSGRIVHAVEGKSKKAILPFLGTLKRKAHQLKAIAMDMSHAYFWAVREALPQVDIVFDHYHIAAIMNRAVDEVRRELYQQLDQQGKQVLKGSRYLLLRNYDKLDDDHKGRIMEVLKINTPLYTIHTMKEQLRLFWHCETREKARGFIETWCQDAMKTTIKPLKAVAKTLWLYRTGLLNYFSHPISNAMVEGIINKIKTLKRQAYGFRDMTYFKLRLYHLHDQRYSLAG